MKRFKEAMIYEKAAFLMIPATIIISIALYFITKNNNAEIKSLVLGAVLSLALNVWHTKTTISISKNNPKRLKAFTVFSYIARYSVYAAMIVMLTLLSNFNPVYTLFGIIEYPIVMMILSFTLIKGDKS